MRGSGRFRRVPGARLQPVAWMFDAARKESVDRLAEAQRLAHVGSWSVDLSTGARTWSDEMYRLLGYEPGEVEPHLDRVFERFHPEDRERLKAAFLAQMAHPEGWHEEFRIVLPGGAVRWLAARTEAVFGPAGDVVGVHGTSQDVTERRRADEQLRFQAQLLNAVDEAIISTDLSGVIVYWGPGAERLYGWSAPEVQGRAIADVIPVVPRAHDREEARLRLALGQPWDGTMERCRKDGSTFVAHVSTTPVHDDTGRLVGNISVCTDVSAQEEANAALERARDQALAASLLKSHFLANMSHEIRTPMNGVLGMTELLLDTALDGDQRGYAEAVRACGDDLLTILNDILDMSEIDAGRVQLESVDFDVAAVIEDVAELFAGRAHAKGIELVISIGDDVPGVVRGDPGRVRQVLVNLLGNAIKFTSTGLVMVSARADRSTGNPDALRLQVDDTGIGIAAPMAARVFEPFSQADSTATRAYGGAGLGLAITRGLVDLIGGQCGVESELGVGSSFWCSLDLPGVSKGVGPPPQADGDLRGGRVLVVDDSPASRLVLEGYLLGWGVDVTVASSGAAALDAARHGAAEGRPFEMALIDTRMPAMDGGELAASLAADPATSAMATVFLATSDVQDRPDPACLSMQLTKPVRRAALHQCLTDLVVAGRALPVASGVEGHLVHAGRILLAEDNEINQKVTVAMLESGGYRVDVAVNGLEAVTAARRNDYDVVLMDCHMPRMDGLAATAAIRAGEGDRGRAPIIALTAAGKQEDRDRCLAAGMDDHLTKPVGKEQLLATVARWAGDANGAFLAANQLHLRDTT
jgi:two-component system sensor histidine kinase/response regulator